MKARDARDDYQAWLAGEVLLIGLLGAAFALFASNATLRSTYELPELRLVISTVIVLAGVVVAVLAGARFAVEGRRLDLLLASGFYVGALSTLLFAIGPVLDSDPIGRTEAWAGIGCQLVSMSLIAAAPFVRGRALARDKALRNALVSCTIWMAVIWLTAFWLGQALPSLAPHGDSDPPFLLTLSLALLALVSLVAVLGFGVRFRNHAVDLDRWLAIGALIRSQ